MKLFIDTNTLLHFTSIDQIDWSDVVKEDRIELLFAPVIISEIDKQKRNSNQKLGKRAKTIVKKIEEAVINEKSFLSFNLIITERPLEQTYLDYSLDKTEQDDRLIATILYYQSKHDDKISLITDDLGLKIKCRSFGINTISLPEKYELRDEDDEAVKEIKKLKEQINKYANQIPKLSLLFTNDKIFTKVKIRSFNIEDFISEKIQNIKLEYPYMPEEKHLGSLFIHPLINSQRVRDYNVELDKFYYEYEDYLRENEDYFRKLNLTTSIQFKLLNKGVIPADNIDVKLHLPDGFTVHESKKIEAPLEEPEPPIKPGVPMTLKPSIFYPIPTRLNIADIPIAGKGLPSIKKTNSYDVIFDLDNLKHNQTFNFRELLLTFDNYEEAAGFTIDYEIYAANVPDIVSGNLNVIVEKE